VTKKKIELYVMTPAIEQQLRSIVAYRSLDFLLLSLVKSFGLDKVTSALNKVIFKIKRPPKTEVLVHENSNT
jgi:hypothetical protein